MSRIQNGEIYTTFDWQADLRDDKKIKDELKKVGQTTIQEADGKKVADKINAAAYIECSAFKNVSSHE